MSRGRQGLVACGLVVATLVAYRPALDGGFVWDDQDYVVENTNLVRPDGLRRIWLAPRGMVQYYPLVHTVLWIEYRLWELRPFGYHLVNVLLHALNAVLLWRLLRHWALPGALVVAFVFALHPIQVESVAWITEIKNLLSGVLVLLAAHAFFVWRARPRARTYGVALGCFGFALLAKTTAVTLPLVLLVLVWWQSGRIERRDVRAVLPMLLLAFLCGAFTLWLETVHVGSEKVVQLGIWERILVPARALVFYAGKIVWPADLVFVYPRWRVDPGSVGQWLFPIAVLAAFALAWSARRRLGRGPLAALLVFALTLAPVSGVLPFYFQLYSFVGDHFQYLAGIGIVALAVVPVARWARDATGPARIAVGRGLPVVVLLLLGFATWTRAGVYRSEETLWRDTLERNPSAWIAHNNLGVVYLRQGRLEDAARHFEATVAARPESPEPHANLGVIYQKRGETVRAVESYRRAVAGNPALVDAQYDLGVLLAQQGDLDGAARHFRDALVHRPRMIDAHMRLGDVLATQGQLDAAAAKYRDALALAPERGDLHYRLGWALASQSAFAAAQAPLAIAVRLNPRDAEALALLGWVAENLGDPATARRRYEEALAANPAVQSARDGLARLGQTR